ncbi:hypothetical protein FRB93_003715 [Tulasnella sp. JGI-2019a]|nr:hypothetical protein FRB93_003715 [Tulasnella sp. JGI-2019a]
MAEAKLSTPLGKSRIVCRYRGTRYLIECPRNYQDLLETIADRLPTLQGKAIGIHAKLSDDADGEPVSITEASWKSVVSRVKVVNVELLSKLQRKKREIPRVEARHPPTKDQENFLQSITMNMASQYSGITAPTAKHGTLHDYFGRQRSDPESQRLKNDTTQYVDDRASSSTTGAGGSAKATTTNAIGIANTTTTAIAGPTTSPPLPSAGTGSVSVLFCLGSVGQRFSFHSRTTAFDFSLRQMLANIFQLPIADLVYKNASVLLTDTPESLGMKDGESVHIATFGTQHSLSISSAGGPNDTPLASRALLGFGIPQDLRHPPPAPLIRLLAVLPSGSQRYVDIPYDTSILICLRQMLLHEALGVKPDGMKVSLLGVGGMATVLGEKDTSRMLRLGHHAIIAVDIRK